jgi:hypothetical protein
MGLEVASERFDIGAYCTSENDTTSRTSHSMRLPPGMSNGTYRALFTIFCRGFPSNRMTVASLPISFALPPEASLEWVDVPRSVELGEPLVISVRTVGEMSLVGWENWLNATVLTSGGAAADRKGGRVEDICAVASGRSVCPFSFAAMPAGAYDVNASLYAGGVLISSLRGGPFEVLPLEELRLLGPALMDRDNFTENESMRVVISLSGAVKDPAGFTARGRFLPPYSILGETGACDEPVRDGRMECFFPCPEVPRGMAYDDLPLRMNLSVSYRGKPIGSVLSPPYRWNIPSPPTCEVGIVSCDTAYLVSFVLVALLTLRVARFVAGRRREHLLFDFELAIPGEPRLSDAEYLREFAERFPYVFRG